MMSLLFFMVVKLVGWWFTCRRKRCCISGGDVEHLELVAVAVFMESCDDGYHSNMNQVFK
jgi:hypothetical protein